MRRFGYINTKGEWLVKPRFVSATPFNGGYARANALFRDSPSPDEAGCSIDRSGRVRHLAGLGVSAEFREGICQRKPGSSTCPIGFVDGEGKAVAPQIYSSATNFHTGRAIACKPVAQSSEIVPHNYDYNAPHELLLIDRSGKVLRKISDERDAPMDFSDGLALSRGTEDKPNRWFDHNGDIAVTFDGNVTAYDFHEGYAVVSSYDSGTGLIDRSGKLVIPRQEQNLGILSEGLIGAEIDGRWYFLNPQGEKVITLPEGCVSVQPFSQGLAAFGTENPMSECGRYYKVHTNGWGFIDRTGKVVIPPQFVGWDSQFTQDGLALVGTDGDAGVRFGFIDSSGKFVIAPQFGTCSQFSEGFAAVQSGPVGFIREDWFGWMDTEDYPDRSEDLREFLKEYNVRGMSRAEIHQLLGAGEARKDDEGDIERYPISMHHTVHGCSSFEFLYENDRVVGWRRTGFQDTPQFHRPDSGQAM